MHSLVEVVACSLAAEEVHSLAEEEVRSLQAEWVEGDDVQSFVAVVQ